MKYTINPKPSIHLDLAAFKIDHSSPKTLSSQRKICTQPTSPNSTIRETSIKSGLIQVRNVLSQFNNFYSPLAKQTNYNKSSIIKYPLMVDQFIKLYNLTKFELNELQSIKQVYYYKPQKITEQNINGEFIAYPKDHIAYRYEIIGMIGQGSFGSVFEVLDHKTNSNFALKIIKNQDKLQKQAQVETNLLILTKEKDPLNQQNIVRLNEQFNFRGHQCLVFEKLDSTLFDALKDQQFRGFDYETLKKFSFQIVKGLNYLKSLKIVHGDIKPENIMMKDKKDKAIKLVDFGSGCIEGNQFYTYIQSRYYRAPEIFFGLRYGCEIDMWSLACVIAELHSGRPLFAGDNELEQINYIIEIIGIPKFDLLMKCPRRKVFFDDYGQPKKTIKTYRKPRSLNLQEFLKATQDDFVDFLQKCLVWEPNLRMTPAQALQHPWFKELQIQEKNKMSNFNNSKENFNKLIQKSSQKQESFEKQLFQQIEKTKIAVSHHKTNSQPLIVCNSPKIEEKQNQKDRQKIALSIHQILKQQQNKKTISIRKPSLD